MIVLESYSGRFGNQVIAYNNLRQIANFLQEDWITPHWKGERIFQENSGNASTVKNFPVYRPSVEFLLQDDKTVIESLKGKVVVIEPTYLGNLTFRFMKKNPKEFLKKELSKIEGRVSVHFRGTDFFQWNPDSILPFSYYQDSIKLCLKEIKSPDFVLFTDDKNLDSFNKTIEFLETEKISWKLGPSSLTNDFMDDFQELSRSDTIISSPSTFAISAGMLGNSRIIHSKSWIDSRVSEKDIFWMNLRASGSQFYSIWQEI